MIASFFLGYLIGRLTGPRPTPTDVFYKTFGESYLKGLKK